MVNRNILGCMASLVLWTGSFCGAEGPIDLSAPSTGMAVQPAQPAEAEPGAQPAPALPSASADRDLNVTPSREGQAATPSAKAAAAAKASKAALADAFIAQSVLRVYLDRPASITVFNSRGQQVAHLDSRRAMEAVPLQGITTGFIYLTVRTAQGELTKKLVYTGK